MDWIKKPHIRKIVNFELSNIFDQQSGEAELLNLLNSQVVQKSKLSVLTRLVAIRMMVKHSWLLSVIGCVFLLVISCRQTRIGSCTVPVSLDHNRMLVDAEIQRKDGSWRQARLWIDTGNPDFFISESLALDLGIDLSAAKEKTGEVNISSLEVPPPAGVRIGGMLLDFSGVKSKVMFGPRWLFNTMHNDANLPSTVLMQYQVVFDYPGLRLTLAEPGTLRPSGVQLPASVHPQTGIVQIDVVVASDTLSLALDNGASYSFVSEDVLVRLYDQHPDWPRRTGAVGCANIWGWWPNEESWLVMRLPEIHSGAVQLDQVGMVGLPSFFPNGTTLGEWYSQKTARAVDGFLGPNFLKAYRVELDYQNQAVYFDKGTEFNSYDMDLVGITLRPETDGKYQVIGISRKDGKQTVEGVEPGDILLKIDDLAVTGATMGTVVDALRGKPGDIRILLVERKNQQFRIEAKVERLL